MKVLIACEESQTSCIAWREAGHEAYSCDIQPCSGGHPEWHIQDDVTKYLRMPWDFVLAHPPCTYLSTAGTQCLYKGGSIHPDRFELGKQAADFFRLCLEANAPRVCVENPSIFTCFGLPRPDQYVHPYYFGDPYLKRTGLWLKGLPLLQASNPVYTGLSYWIGNDNHGKYPASKEKSAVIRSKSFPGMCRAMVDQWGHDQLLYLF